ncbi:uncharacterized protein LOC115483022 [Drosophila hydei]|uniref:Uncharacterized protein LOC115483022 n=1 Tax=Drosophila hydei TaxID=7224 RepID=A0A6J2SPH7_DROHY|nr:uncharacterized protein LOC115483022 [Drosophila hydei]
MESNRNLTTAGEQLTNIGRDDSSCSDDGIDNQSAQFYFGRVTPPKSLIATDRLKAACILADNKIGNHVGQTKAELSSDSLDELLTGLDKKKMDMTTLSNSV